MGRFDQGPAEIVRAVLAQRAAPVALAGLLDAWREAGVADELARAGEACDVAELRRLGADHRYVPLLTTLPGIA